jgi:hypothetical protein
MQSWTPAIFQDWNAVTVGNRYFSTSPAASAAEVVPFDKDIDPDGFLASVDKIRYHHTSENQVNYFEREIKEVDGFR